MLALGSAKFELWQSAQFFLAANQLR